MFVAMVILAACLMAGVLWAGSTDPTKAPWPHGLLEVRIGGYVANGLGAGSGAVFETWIAPFDCYVRKVVRSYKGGTAHLDAILLQTVDATKKTIVASLDASADIAGVAQSLHADIVNFKIVAGNGIELQADSSGSNEAGWIVDRIYVEPAYQKVATGGS